MKKKGTRTCLYLHTNTHNPIPTSLFLPRPQHTFSCRVLPLRTTELSHSTVVVHLPGLQEVWVRIPLVELIFPSLFPFYLSSSPSDLHTPPFFQSTRREIGSETTDNLSEDNPVKNAYRASAHALIPSQLQHHRRLQTQTPTYLQLYYLKQLSYLMGETRRRVRPSRFP